MMSRIVFAFALPVLALPCLSACQKHADAADPGADVQAIMNVEGAMRAAYLTRDAAKLAALYAKDATVYVPHGQPRIGAEAIAKGARQDFADPGFKLSFTSAKVAAGHGSGWTKGAFTVHYTDPKTGSVAHYSGHYLTLFVKQADGSWKVTEDMPSPGAPDAPPAPAS